MSFTEQTISKFLRSRAYHPEWVIESVSGGANAIYLAEWLTSALDLNPGMKILDLGCGRAATSIFLAREYNVTVFATDLWFNPSENLQRIQGAGLAQSVFPIHADARHLPFADDFFDAILSIDAFPYFGTDDHYLNYLTRFVRPNGVIATASSGFLREIDGTIPSHLSELLTAEPSMLSMHSSPWWRRHWEKSGIVDVETADSMPDGWQLWIEWLETLAPENLMEIEAIRTDAGRNLGYNRVVCRRRSDACLNPPIVTIPPNYTQKPLLRDNP